MPGYQALTWLTRRWSKDALIGLSEADIAIKQAQVERAEIENRHICNGARLDQTIAEDRIADR